MIDDPLVDRLTNEVERLRVAHALHLARTISGDTTMTTEPTETHEAHASRVQTVLHGIAAILHLLAQPEVVALLPEKDQKYAAAIAAVAGAMDGSPETG